MRRYIRHPSDIPLRCSVPDAAHAMVESLRDVGYGGLCFVSQRALSPGQLVALQIDKVSPPFSARGRVVWCRAEDDRHFVVGVEFLDAEQAYRARMVEQVCHIEHYRREVQYAEGRRLSGEEAAREWIARFADEFPPADPAEAEPPARTH